jgi:hypothetical protein
MYKLIIIIALFGFLFQNAASQDYFPLKIGNKFVYNYSWTEQNHGGYQHGSGIKVMQVIDTTTLLNRKYFRCIGSPYFLNSLVRVDSLTKNLFKYDSTNSCNLYYKEKLLDSLKMITPGFEGGCNNAYFNGKLNDTLFGINSFKINFSYSQMFSSNVRYYNSIFGMCGYSYQSDVGSEYHIETYQLKGCIINGIKYGDTSTTDIKSINSTLPDNYCLFQNYPNPFNPSTIIKFQIKDFEFVVLKVCDILGKEIATLVNEKLQPGVYEIPFSILQSTGNQLSSGVYFYTLETTGYKDTKRMLLIK